MAAFTWSVQAIFPRINHPFSFRFAQYYFFDFFFYFRKLLFLRFISSKDNVAAQNPFHGRQRNHAIIFSQPHTVTLGNIDSE